MAVSLKPCREEVAEWGSLGTGPFLSHIKLFTSNCMVFVTGKDDKRGMHSHPSHIQALLGCF